MGVSGLPVPTAFAARSTSAQAACTRIITKCCGYTYDTDDLKLLTVGLTMSSEASPLVLRRRLRTELRAARLRNELTQDQVAGAMQWSLSKMNRIEKAQTGISINDLRALLTFYNITDNEQIAELFTLARAAKQHPWWRGYRGIASLSLLELMDYESASSALSQFETLFIPGILQTEEYASAVLQLFYGGPSDDRIAALVDLRARRRDLLINDDVPKFSFILDESVIQRLVGHPAIMSRQLQHLIGIAELPNVTIQITPFIAGLHPGMKGSFEIVRFDNNPDESVVFLENTRGDFISDDPMEVNSYLEAFDLIRELSLGPLDSIRRMSQAADETI
jgi:transcriptional regulator with XRE-family HTH domain